MYLTNIPEMDTLIMDSMDDDTLVRYCQTSTTNQDLCLIPSVVKRIETYKRYLNFKIGELDNIEQYLTFPYMLMYQNIVEEGTVFYSNLNIYIIEKDKYYYIGYIGSKDEHGIFNVVIEDYGWENRSITIHEIFSNTNNKGEEYFDFDLYTVYNIYVQLGFKKYAKNEVKKYLNLFIDNMINDDSYQSFFNLLALYLKIKMHCIYLNLIDDNIDNQNYNIDDPKYFDSDQGINNANHLVNEIFYYYDLLIQHIN
jgi:hypothetical protein